MFVLKDHKNMITLNKLIQILTVSTKRNMIIIKNDSNHRIEKHCRINSNYKIRTYLHNSNNSFKCNIILVITVNEKENEFYLFDWG